MFFFSVEDISRCYLGVGEKELPRYREVSNFDGREQRNVPFLGGAMEGWMEGWIDGWIDGWKDGLMDQQMDKQSQGMDTD